MSKKIKKAILFLILSFSFFSYFVPVTKANNYLLENEAFYAYKDHYTATYYKKEGTAFYASPIQVDGTVPVYRFYNTTNGDHFYTRSETEKNKLVTNRNSGYQYENIAFYTNPIQIGDTVPVYRFYNLVNGDHFYTINEAEKNKLITTLGTIYQYENIAFYANPIQIEDTVPVYRFYNITSGDHFYTANEAEAQKLNSLSEKNSEPIYRFYNIFNGDHFYTSSETEKNKIIANLSFAYKYEGVGFYAYKNQIEGTSPIYRFYNKTSGDHFYTASETEKDNLINSNEYYSYENIGFYAFASETANTLPVYRLYNGIDHFYTINAIEKNYLVSSGIGPNISVGLWYYDKTGIQDSPFRIDANKPYNIKDNNGNVLAQIGADTTTKVTYDSDGYLEVYDSISSTLVKTSVTFDAADGDNTNMIFNAHRPDSSFDEYRGKITVKYYKGNNIIAGTSDTVTQIWVINTLPLEHYVWGMGETTGTGDIEHTKVMTTIFRTYGRWYIEYATKYLPLGFKIRSDSGSQIYYGYEWESAHSNIKKAAEATRGSVATYGDEIALTPYSSWTDGRTRSFEERWGSKDYPWCKSVSDPYGKNTSLSTAQLEASGNHMVGMSANGSVVLARDHDWDCQRIMKYYYTGISLEPLY
jgi:hypothetical protein